LKHLHAKKEVSSSKRILVETSARHIHLSKKDADNLFGNSYSFHKLRKLSQPAQYSVRETLDLIGRKSTLKNVRIILPTRKNSQVEVSITDCYSLGIKPVLRMSGNTIGTPKIIIKGPNGEIKAPAIVAKRHLHLSDAEAKELNVRNNQKVRIMIKGKRALLLDEIITRVGNEHKSALHLDTDEANAAMIKGKTTGELL